MTSIVAIVLRDNPPEQSKYGYIRWCEVSYEDGEVIPGYVDESGNVYREFQRIERSTGTIIVYAGVFQLKSDKKAMQARARN